MEATGELKQMQNMVGELTRDASKPTVAVVGSREGGGKLIVALTEGTIAADNHNAVEILNSIASHIGGGGGGRPTFAQGGGSNAEGLGPALDAARSFNLDCDFDFIERNRDDECEEYEALCKFNQRGC